MSEVVDKLVDDHWGYVEEVLSLHKVDNDLIKTVEYHYKSAMLHGFKHGVESVKGESDNAKM